MFIDLDFFKRKRGLRDIWVCWEGGGGYKVYFWKFYCVNIKNLELCI